jgi:hypothetical protein
MAFCAIPRSNLGVHVSHGTSKFLSMLGMIAGFASIIASIAIWFAFKTDDRAHAERFGIFVGLWAPTFFILSNWIASRGEHADSGAAKVIR